jgi:uncharacterized small protein (DUF1192 family)
MEAIVDEVEVRRVVDDYRERIAALTEEAARRLAELGVDDANAEGLLWRLPRPSVEGTGRPD